MQNAINPGTVRPLVEGRGNSVSQLLGGASYGLDYFQRRYVWEKEQVTKLVDDLSSKFLDQWSSQHAPAEVQSYDPYFLGPVITYRESGRLLLADGQQRFVSLLLLLIHLRRLLLEQEDYNAATSVSAAISNHQYGRTSFTVDVEEYHPCFDALLNDRQYNTDGAAPHVIRVWEAYQHIRECLPEEIREEALPYFADWLMNRVSLVEIGAGDSQRAWEVFQSINDRGVHLKPMDHLKGYLIHDAIGNRAPFEEAWLRMVARLEQVEQNAAFGFVQTVLRARLAAVDPDGTFTRQPGPDLAKATHEWVRAHVDEICPGRKNGDLALLIPSLFVPLSETYRKLLRAKQRLAKGLDAVFFNSENGIAQQFDLAMACVQVGDTESTKTQKIQAIANFIDLLVVRNAVNNRKYSQDVLNETVVRLLPAMRLVRTVEDLRTALVGELTDVDSAFEGVETLRYRESNSQFVHYLLARLTAWLESGAERGDLIGHYLAKRDGKRVFQVEHLFPNSNETYKNLIWDAEEYRQWRSRIGGLVLLDGDENASLGDLPLATKVDSYRNHNLLAASLHPTTRTIRGLAKFRRFIKEQGLQQAFRHYEADEPFTDLIEQRGRLLRAMCERIWNPERLGLAKAAATHTPQPKGGKRRGRTNYGVDMEKLVNAGLVNAGEVLVGYHLGRSYKAVVQADGRIRTSSGGAFDSPSAAAMDALNRSSYNGWAFWRLERDGQSIDKLRSRYLENRSEG